MITPPPPIAGAVVIDLSHWDGIVDFSLFPPEINRCVVKLTDGQNMGDPLAGYNARAGREAGKSMEFYHFLQPNIDPIDQLRVFKAALYGVFWQPTERICLDFELTGSKSISLLRAFFLQSYRTVLSVFQVVPEIYTRMSFWNAYVGLDWRTIDLPEPPLFTADYGWYGDGRPLTSPRWVKLWRRWHRWQYTDRGVVPGVQSKADLSVEQ